MISSKRAFAIRRCSAAVAFGLAAALLPSCMLRDLRRNLEVFDQQGFLLGKVTIEPRPAEGEAVGSIVVFAYPDATAPASPTDWFVLRRAGPYFLIVPVGRYRIAAFVDRNGDLIWEPGEPVGVYDGGAPVSAQPGAVTRGVDLVLRLDNAGTLPIAVALPADNRPGIDDLPASRVGEVVTLDDARFSQRAAKMGLWRPIDFLFKVGAGIYFLEPYDPARIPVLFVHGAVGQPAQWRYLIEHLDRRRYQVWVAYYPTAVRLEILAAALDRWLQVLQTRYGFHRMGLVAHSMGGLVARAYLGRDSEGIGGTMKSVPFVSISTPWQGHSGAALGVENSPVVAPSWYDMAPGSPFLNALVHTPLPAHVTHDLFFSYGDNSSLRGDSNDGVVTLASQLDLHVQLRARRVLGFDASHATVLTSPEVAVELQHTLDELMPTP